MSQQRGTPAVWSIPNTTITGVGSLSAPIVQGYTYKPEPEQKKLRGVDGVTRNRTFFDTIEKLTFDLRPSAATRALAGAQNVFPTIGSDITILSGTNTGAGGACAETQATGSGSGDGTGAFIVVGGEKRLTPDDYGVMTLELERGEVHLPTLA